MRLRYSIAALLLLALAVPAAAQAPTFLGRRAGTNLWGLAEGRVAGEPGRADLLVGAAPGSVFVIPEGGSPSPTHPTLPADLELALGSGHSSLASGWLRRTARGIGPAQIIAGGTDRVVVAGPVTSRSGTETITFRNGTSQTLGSALALSDVNDDGFDDLWIGDPTTSRVYLVLGHVDLIGRDFAVTPADVVINGAGIGAVLSTGDVTADGRPDLLIGAPANGGAGAVYLIKGGRALPATLNLPADADAVFTGIATNDFAGSAVEAADLDGDGFGDLVMTAYRDRRWQPVGAAYIFWGRADLSSRSVSTADVTLQSNVHEFGMGLAVGDLNRDNHHDIIIRGDLGTTVYMGRPRSLIPPVVTAYDRTLDCPDISGSTVVPRRPRDVLVFDRGGSGRDAVVSCIVPGTTFGAVAFFPFAAGGSLYSDSGHVTRTLVRGQSATVTVGIRTLSTTPLNWSITLHRNPPGNWVNVSPTTGASVAGAPGTFNVDFTTDASMAVGTYSASITVIPEGQPEQHQFTIPVTLTVTATTPPPPSTKNDFNGDGQMDLLWQDQEQGYLAVWSMTPGDWRRLASSDLLSPNRVPDTNWKIVGTGDFNADGKPDIVWQEQTQGWIGIWLMDGLSLIQSLTLSPQSFERVADTNWKIAGVLDFNADGKPDILWHEQTQGWLVAWLCDGLNVTSSVSLTPERILDPNFEARATGDMNADGQSDIVWQNRVNGVIEIWLLSGLTVSETVLATPNAVSDTNWKIVAAGDLDGDGKTDLVWQEMTQGWLAAWLMNGRTMTGSFGLIPDRVPQTNWKIVGPR